MRLEDFELNKNISPLFSLPKKNVYRVPQGFFDELEFSIRRKYPQRKKGMLRRFRKVAQLSVAAAIAILIVFSGIKIFLHKDYLPVETIRMIYTVQDGDRDGQ